MSETERPPGQLEYREATQIGVSFQKRTIDLIVMPYEEETVVMHDGRMIREVVARGAFDGIEKRPRRVKVNRDHDVAKVVGQAVTFHPSRQEGLVAECRISKIPLGDDTLELARDGLLDASAGFLPLQNRSTGELMEEWPHRDYRRLLGVWLGHIAMVPEPAYQGAKVLAVRETANGGLTEVSGTPNLDLVRSWRMQEQYERLSHNV